MQSLKGIILLFKEFLIMKLQFGYNSLLTILTISYIMAAIIFICNCFKKSHTNNNIMIYDACCSEIILATLIYSYCITHIRMHRAFNLYVQFNFMATINFKNTFFEYFKS
jgi:hypothetical protein